MSSRIHKYSELNTAGFTKQVRKIKIKHSSLIKRNATISEGEKRFQSFQPQHSQATKHSEWNPTFDLLTEKIKKNKRNHISNPMLPPQLSLMPKKSVKTKTIYIHIYIRSITPKTQTIFRQSAKFLYSRALEEKLWIQNFLTIS